MLLLRTSSENHLGYFEAQVKGDNFPKYLDAIKQIPSRQYVKSSKVWRIAIQDFDILRNECEKRRLKTIDVDFELKQLISSYKKWQSETKELAEQDDCDLSIDPSICKLPLMPHQKVAIEFFLKRKIAINASEMGTGKTYPALVTAKHLFDIGEIRNCLIVCIASVKWNWVAEIQKCVNGCSYTVIEGKPEDREKLYYEKTLFKIVNYEILRNDIDTILYGMKFDCIIVDEIHRIRTHKAKQTKTLYKLGKNAKYRFGLTGTPVQNKLEDLFSVMKFIHPNLLGNWFVFDRRYIIKGYWGEVADYRRLDEVHEKLKTIMIRKRKKEVLKDLPDKVYQDIFVDMSVKQRKFYNDVKNQILDSELEDVEEKIEQANILANVTYLREVCDSTELVDPSKSVSTKTKECKRIVEDLLENDHKIVIFSQFKRMVKILERDLKVPAILLHGGVPTTGGERSKLIDEFGQSKKKNVFIMTTAGGEGINLQCADYIIFFDLPFNPQVIAQVEDRLHRRGQENTVNVIKLLAKDSIEERVLEILKFKTRLFREVVDGVSGKPFQVSQKEILGAI